MANTSSEQLAVSPLKTHSLSKQRNISEAKSKLGRACSSIEERVAAAIDVESDQLKRKDPCANIPTWIQAKATDLDTLTYLMKEFESRKTIPGTRSFHHFSPPSEGEVTYKRVSNDEVVAETFKFFDVLADQISNIKIMEFIVCQYDSLWWVGYDWFRRLSTKSRKFWLNLCTPPGPRRMFKWPAREDLCWLPFDKFICKIDTPTTVKGRMYQIRETDYIKIFDL